MSRTTNTSNKRFTRSAVAGGIAVLLLAGGGATWAGWDQSQNVGASQVQTGNLALTAPVGTWTLYHATATDMSAYDAGTVIPAGSLSSTKIVPGDKLVYNATTNVTLLGKNIKATMGTAGMPTGVTGLTVNGPTMTVDGSAVGSLVEGDSGKTVAAATEIIFPFIDNTGQANVTTTVDLSAVTLKLQQVL